MLGFEQFKKAVLEEVLNENADRITALTDKLKQLGFWDQLDISQKGQITMAAKRNSGKLPAFISSVDGVSKEKFLELFTKAFGNNKSNNAKN